MTPSMPTGKYVSRSIRPTRAGSKMTEEKSLTKNYYSAHFTGTLVSATTKMPAG